MPKEPKKTPNESPHFTVRLSKDQKNCLNDLIEDVRIALNRKLNKDREKLWMKNDVVYQALILGLPQLKKQGQKS